MNLMIIERVLHSNIIRLESECLLRFKESEETKFSRFEDINSTIIYKETDL